MKHISLPILLAFVLWTIMFSPWTAPHLNFWACMTCSAVILTALSFWLAKPWWTRYYGQTSQQTGSQPQQTGQTPQQTGKIPLSIVNCQLSIKQCLADIALGIGIAVLLWCIFWLGDKLSQVLFPTFARVQVNSIYGMKDGSSAVVLSLLLLFIIGPAEEIFWREFVQRKLADCLPTLHIRDLTLGPRFLAYVLATLVYTLVHLFSFNFMLIMAALVCGAVWGLLYWLFPKRFPAILLSHALWDAAVFIWFPI